MIEKVITAVEPFAITLIIVAGASLAGWVNFSNKFPVGVAVVGFGILLLVKHVYQQVHTSTKKG